MKKNFRANRKASMLFMKKNAERKAKAAAYTNPRRALNRTAALK